MRKYFINIILFITPLVLIGTINIFNTNKPTISELENRALKSKPIFSLEKLFSGNYFKEFDEYYADTFSFRDKFVKINRDLMEVQNIFNEDGALLVENEGFNALEKMETVKAETNNSNEEKTDELDISYEPVSNTEKNDESKLTGRIFLLKDRAMETHIFNAESAEYYAQTINSFSEKVNNVKVYSLIAPIQIEFLNDKKYNDISSPQKKTINYVNKFLNNNVIIVDAYSKISENINKYLYFRTDHHWTALGAYYAYTGFMESKGEKVISLDEYEIDEVKSFLGTTYSSTLSKRLEENPDTVYIYKPFINSKYTIYEEEPIEKNVIDMNFINQKNKYGVFLSGDHPLGKITTEIKNDKKILIIKDSYANAFVPFLIPHYNEIYIVDPRMFKSNIVEFINENEINEVLFLNYIHVTGNKSFSELIRKMMEK